MNVKLQIHENIIEKLNYFYKIHKIPNILFHGNSGVGKRTIVDNFINMIYNGNKEIIIASSPDFAALNVMIFKHGKGLYELVGNFGSMNEIILNKNVISLPMGSQGLGSEFCFRNGSFYELIYHDPKPTK